MTGYSEDLRKKLVRAVERGMSKAQAARTFDVSLSSIKRYVNKANRGEPLAPKKSPGPRSEEHTSELQSHSDLHSFPTRRSSDLGPGGPHLRRKPLLD